MIKPSLLLLTCPRTFISWKMFAAAGPCLLQARLHGAYSMLCRSIARHGAGKGLGACTPMPRAGQVNWPRMPGEAVAETGAASGRDVP